MTDTRMGEQTERGRRTWRFWAALVLVPAALVILLSLGTWQVNRLHWKESLLADIQQRSTAAPVDIAELERLLAAGEAVDYRHAMVKGRYLNDKERHFSRDLPGPVGLLPLHAARTCRRALPLRQQGLRPL